MSASNLSNPVFRAFDSNGAPLAGGKLYSYSAGTTSLLDTYTDSTQSVANANPVILDSDGQAQVWLGASIYKLVLKDSLDVVQWTIDNIQGLSNLTGSQWLISGDTPTFISATSFKIPADKTSTYHVNRRLQMFITDSTLYGTISATSYSAPDTTVTVTLDSGALNNTLSVVNYGFLTAVDHAIPLGVYASVSGNLSQFAATTSAQLAGVISDETGTGPLVFGTSPALTTPTGIVKGDVGLGNVNNTTDAAKPVSTAQQTALDLKAALAGADFTGRITTKFGTDIPTGGVITLGTDGNAFHLITSTAAITDFTHITGSGSFLLITDTVRTITHAAGVLETNTGADITTAVGDRFRLDQDSDGTTWLLTQLGQAANTFSGAASTVGSNQAIATNTFTKVKFDTSYHDTDSILNLPNWQMTIPAVLNNKWVNLKAGINWAGGVGTVRELRILINGVSLFVSEVHVSSVAAVHQITTAHAKQVFTGDVITVECWHNVGATLNVTIGGFFDLQVIGS